MNKEIDHDYTDEIVCPYCGYEFSDSWEIGADSGEEECYECGEKFEFYRHIEVSYCTAKSRINKNENRGNQAHS
jgi:hypothetical protein